MIPPFTCNAACGTKMPTPTLLLPCIASATSAIPSLPVFMKTKPPSGSGEL